MMQLDIDNGVDVEIAKDLDKPRLSSIVVEFQVHGEHMRRAFFIPDSEGCNEENDLVAFMFDKSLTGTIDHGFRLMMRSSPDVLRGYSFYVVPSTDGQTNITPKLIDTLMMFK